MTKTRLTLKFLEDFAKARQMHIERDSRRQYVTWHNKLPGTEAISTTLKGAYQDLIDLEYQANTPLDK